MLTRRALLGGLTCSAALAAAPALARRRAPKVADPGRVIEQPGLFRSSFQKIDAVKRIVGYGNFNILGFDRMILFGRNYPEHMPGGSPFRTEELELLEALFAVDARTYGFLGEKTAERLTERIPEQDVRKVPGTGHYVYRGHSDHHLTRINKAVGDQGYLTSGVRGLPKQFHLWMGKVIECGMDPVKASWSLAPPGYSFHGLGDFDIGQKGLGARNFTEDFAHTEVFKRLLDLDLIELRYTRRHATGVRYEPWHVKVVSG
ncbi:M15 family metallopeptidase [Thiohalorhabdus methylotrophus]|uniref:M15 family metallopeptidase n=1 Tax=Thiohalorhabdus methylotrophus TaxID=3242694 RepID=A0ABV4U2L7_9GAMM